MGMSTGGGGPHAVKSDINVTPLVDVVLVLLIIFLVTMPILMRDITLEIPRKAEEAVEQAVDTQVIVELTLDGTVRLNGENVTKFELSEKLATQLKTKREKVVFVGFDDDVKYGDAVEIMDLAKGCLGKDVEIKIALKMKDDKAATPAEGAQPAN